ncbi:ATP-binding cassette domain-containing protein [Paenibacillus kobensis]|uniref:ATP-binding cassette domain-containing protein n=1 Tax=Paenibacillus kobensis TaxID=59841 RepID=UPI000FDBDC3B|nr:ATP-binding cassette domain-containing protein [Paenibacillus kobensis]
MGSSWRLDGVTVRSGSKDILRGIDASFEQGTITLLIGPNGAGKTTLLETVAGLRPAEEGTVSLGELLVKNGRRMNREVLLRTGISFQQSSSQWFLPTVAEEFRYSLRPYRLEEKKAAVHERMLAALEAAGLDHPQTLLSRDPKSLSGGQQKRLALAMLLATEPDWLLLDEPTAGLDLAGVNQLASILLAHRERGGGALIVTHDIEALLPLADSVVIIEAGRIRAVRTAAEHAAVIRAMEAPSMPQPLALARQLHEAGFEPSGTSSPWATPRELAAALATKLRGAETSADASSVMKLHGIASEPPQAEQEAAGQALPSVRQQPYPSQSELVRRPGKLRSWLWPSAAVRDDRFDPRAIIVCYYLFGTGALLQQSWYGLLAVSILAYAFVWRPLGSAIAPWRGAVLMYMRMILVFVLFAGIQVSPFGFDVEAALITGFRLSKLLVVMVTGLPITAMVTPLRLQRALEQTFGWMERVRVPVRQAALTVALIFRFVPMLMQEWERFVRIALARGKSAAKPGKLPARMLYAVLAPFLHGMLRSADELTNALEARGFGRVESKPTRALVLKWSREDYFIVALFIVWFGFMYLLPKLLL